MLGIVGVWPSKHGEIIKSELSNGRRKKLLPSVVEFTYDWLRFEGYLGNVGLDCTVQSCGRGPERHHPLSGAKPTL